MSSPSAPADLFQSIARALKLEHASESSRGFVKTPTPCFSRNSDSESALEALNLHFWPAVGAVDATGPRTTLGVAKLCDTQ